MARWDSYLKTVERKLRRLESKRAMGKISDAMRTYAKTKQLPKNEFLREWVEDFTNAVKEMSKTMPGPYPDPPGYEPNEVNIKYG